ncbi:MULTISPECIES: N-acetyl-gamma-glutamyl-phosphate reductase [Thiomicrorhabdus]|uniref:N-acetyl-gamma-glutamyl-phosphate reductase n=1 Tax=Thiomicrorhabdus heinhorstiae TaxID=2748010 RepID=A0ABS0BZN9_9GAMM|nr:MULTISPECIES: N-acetyl-gamma-glutamyl-phosphate reductase [Thiomicrorhabdus]MBF6058326.1 N-acetyl-gamma-glutamyl-phosphate reductase [Thiomicrorhabdus heinhorstiae]
MKRIQVGIVGGTGYTGVELLRLLANHPAVEVKAITSRSEAGLAVADMFPNLRGIYDLAFSEPKLDVLSKCDVVFFATPHGVAMNMTPELIEAGVKVIDLAADFRIEDMDVWESWYGMPHACPEIMDEVVYGLPELNREKIRGARVIANPGCYPTAVQLGFYPLLKEGLVDIDHLIADAKSGISGAGRGAKVGSLAAETSEGFKAYGISGHRHLPEIRQGLEIMADAQVNLTFVPHLLPMIRGIEATLYGKLKSNISQEDLQKLYEETYAQECFVDVMPANSLPDTRMVKGSNMCRMAVYRPEGGDVVVVTSVIDNLVKGAAGQAVQNMNLMFDLEEDAGLTQVALMP